MNYPPQGNYIVAPPPEEVPQYPPPGPYPPPCSCPPQNPPQPQGNSVVKFSVAVILVSLSVAFCNWAASYSLLNVSL
ncbi:hypothetical protein L1049_015189 [Liquidambar formosana]|uniref:Uncharacterized protein n=1 Tax=Liquidambar formosana TaxID=63359 RepID=A0AAP0RYG1_LIQFO